MDEIEIARQQTENIVAPINEAKAAEDAANMAAEEKKKKNLLEAAAVCEALNTEGGRIIQKNIEKLMDDAIFAPEAYMAGDKDNFDVSVTRVAIAIGVRDGLQALKSWLGACERVIMEKAREVKANEPKV